MNIKKALISVFDKTGLEELAKALDSLGIEIISTGGTARAISAMGIKVTEISAYTGYPEMLDGRVKTLHPAIHAGLLSVRGDKKHDKAMKESGISYIDIVVVNLYPFEKTVARRGVTEEEAVENIDVGGPAMLRSGAKNFASVAVVSSPDQYNRVIRELKETGGLKAGTLKALAIEAFKRTSAYDNAICRHLSGGSPCGGEKDLPETMDINLERVYALRYGENPHQRAAFYRCASSAVRAMAGAEKLQGKELSFNNIMDIDAAVNIVSGFERPAVSVVKHGNPAGVAAADTPENAYLDALDSDRVSAFGGIMAFNRGITVRAAETILKESDFVECIAAPAYESAALEALKNKKNMRVLKVDIGEWARPGGKDIKKVAGGFLVQDTDAIAESRAEMSVVTDKKPDKDVMDALLFAWEIVKHVKSNAIVLARGTKTVGIGAGQMSRVDSVITAVRKAGKRASGAVLASDAFFPMPDSVEIAREAGIRAIIQPGGSIRDKDVIEACDRAGIAMVFTGKRHFRH